MTDNRKQLSGQLRTGNPTVRVLLFRGQRTSDGWLQGAAPTRRGRARILHHDKNPHMGPPALVHYLLLFAVGLFLTVLAITFGGRF